MKNSKTIRLYLMQYKKEVSPGKFEIPFSEYREDGSLLCDSIEDFTEESLRKIKAWYVAERDLEYMVNGSTRFIWRRVDMIHTTHPHAARILAYIRHGKDAFQDKRKKLLRTR